MPNKSRTGQPVYHGPHLDCVALPLGDVVQPRGRFSGALIAKNSAGFLRKVVAGVDKMQRT